MEVLILLALILLNGLFAMSEMAVVSSRKIRLQQMAQVGRAGARAALDLAENPSHFLSTIQVGITTIGIFSGAYGEASLVSKLAPVLADIPGVDEAADELALAAVVIGITFASLILGELVPKRIALHRPESIASLIARPMALLSRVSLPFVRFLSWSTEVVLKLLRMRAKDDPPVTEEEIQGLMKQGLEAGVFEKEEHALVSRIFRLDEQRIPAIMTPRMDMTYLDLEDPLQANLERIADTRFTRYPVCRGGLHEISGILDATELLERMLRGAQVDLAALLRPALYVPETVTIMDLLEHFKANKAELALVVDEFGEVEGVVTLADVLQALVGDLPALGEEGAEDVVRRDDGSWLIDGSVSTDRLHEVLATDEPFPGEADGGYHTIAGFVMTQLGRIPKVSENFVWEDWRFEVVDMDRHRVDRILVSANAGSGAAASESGAAGPDTA